jgi:hypothetical protein
MMNRRSFLKSAGAGALATSAWAQSEPIAKAKSSSAISQLKKNTAIAMWDFTWILRHHPKGAFGNWDQVLEGLAERGYDSIRMDCMPQYVAADTDGRLQDEFSGDGNPRVLWGADGPITFRPREALLEFLPKCRKYGIKVGLSSWFMRHDSKRTAIFSEEGGLLRAWRETLAFLDQQGLLDDNIMYVDLLNEYPDWHGYDWLHSERNKRSNAKKFKLNNPNANIPDPDMIPDGASNPLAKEFYNDFLNHLIRDVRKAYPQLDCFASISSSYGHVDMSHMDAIDIHAWFANHDTGLRWNQGSTDVKADYEKLMAYWDANKAKETALMDERITDVSNQARKLGVVCGNTEGWGSVDWSFDIDWRFIREAAEICIDLALKHDNYRFICTSNFTHPHFGFWDDIPWHRRMTDRIKGGAR